MKRSNPSLVERSASAGHQELITVAPEGGRGAVQTFGGEAVPVQVKILMPASSRWWDSAQAIALLHI